MEENLGTCKTCGKDSATVLYKCEMPDNDTLFLTFCTLECLDSFLKTDFMRNLIKERMEKMK